VKELGKANIEQLFARVRNQQFNRAHGSKFSVVFVLFSVLTGGVKTQLG